MILLAGRRPSDRQHYVALQKTHFRFVGLFVGWFSVENKILNERKPKVTLAVVMPTHQFFSFFSQTDSLYHRNNLPIDRWKHSHTHTKYNQLKCIEQQQKFNGKNTEWKRECIGHTKKSMLDATALYAQSWAILHQFGFSGREQRETRNIIIIIKKWREEQQQKITTRKTTHTEFGRNTTVWFVLFRAVQRNGSISTNLRTSSSKYMEYQCFHCIPSRACAGLLTCSACACIYCVYTVLCVAWLSSVSYRHFGPSVYTCTL